MDDLKPLLTARAKRDADALFDAVPSIKKRSDTPLLAELNSPAVAVWLKSAPPLFTPVQARY